RQKRERNGRVVQEDADEADLRRGRTGWMMADKNVRPTKMPVVSCSIDDLLINGGGVARIARFFAVGRNGAEESLREVVKEILEFAGCATTTRNIGLGCELHGPLWRVSGGAEIQEVEVGKT